MSLKPDDIQALVNAFEASDWAEMNLTLDGTTLRLSRTGAVEPMSRPSTAPVSPASSVAAPPAAPPAPPSASPPRAASDPSPAVGTSSAATPADSSTSAALPIRSPSVGVFWRSPQPGAPPFAEVGQLVEPDDTVCIVEVMKLMNHVQAGIRGVIRSVEAVNGEMVEHNQTLFTVEPEA